MNEALIFFILTLVLSYLAIRYCAPLSNVMLKLGEYLAKRVFLSVSGYEHNKFALLRIIFGGILVIRSLFVLQFLLPSEYFSPVGLWSIAELIGGICLVLGLFTQWAFIFLMAGMWQIGDQVVEKSTLGNDIAAMVSLLLLLTNAGKYISLDAKILKFVPKSKYFLFYYEGDPTPEQIALAKFGAVISYWALCMYSLAIHLNEPAWTTGVAGPLLLTNNFMSSWYAQLIVFFSSSENFTYLGKISLWSIMPWYALILPFVILGGIFRAYIVIFGILFFSLSFFVLNLGSLAEIEFVLWAAIFWSTLGLNANKSIQIFYDDRCNLCDKTVQVVTFIDVFGIVKLKPASTNQDILMSHGITRDQSLTELYGLIEDKATLTYGYDFYIQLSKSLVLLWPLLPLLLLGKALKIGPVMYRFIAKRRLELFGICELPRKKLIRTSTRSYSRSKVTSVVILHVMTLTVFYFLTIPMPYLGFNSQANARGEAAHYYGIAPINVFNHTDLRMAENWFTLVSLDFKERVPLFTDEGSRLNMHKSDRIYFGHTLQFRRATIGSDICQFEIWEDKITYLSKVYLSAKQAKSGLYTFKYTQKFQALPDWELLVKNKYLKTSTVDRCTVIYLVDHAG
ncbi:MAG: DUF393 domain-containing protein [Gammaproteobacteria bacterium]|nr:DUF393 domain-containing protein [Gammaproteobacteria bacterium]